MDTATDKSEIKLKEAAQDSGYAWIITLSSFCMWLIYGGCQRSEGVFFLTFQARFQASAHLTASLAAFLAGIQGLTSPLATAFIRRYSVRTSVILAAVTGSTGLMLCAFAPNIYVLFLTYSCMLGICRGIALTVSLIGVNQYFNKRRGQAIAIAYGGGGIGGLSMLPIVQWLLDVYGYKGTFLILGAILLNGLVCAFLYRPFSFHLRLHRVIGRIEAEDSDFAQPLAELNGSTKSLLADNAVQIDHRTREETSLFHREEHIHNGTAGHEQSPAESVAENGTGKTPLLQGDIYESFDDTEEDGEQLCCSKEKCTKAMGVWWMTLTKEWNHAVSFCFPVDSANKPKDKPDSLFSWRIFTSPAYVLVCISSIFFQLANILGISFFPASAFEKGFTSSQVAFIVGCFQLSDTSGKLIAGSLIDRPLLRRYQGPIFVLIQLLSGLGYGLVPFARNAMETMFAGWLAAFFIAAAMPLRILFIGSIVGNDAVDSAFGALLIFVGVGSIVGPPVTGALKDIYSTFDFGFYIAGLSMFTAALLCGVSVVLLAWRNNKSTSKGPSRDMSRSTSCLCFSQTKTNHKHLCLFRDCCLKEDSEDVIYSKLSNTEEHTQGDSGGEEDSFL